jgi:4-amino-4-deoxy-L-arabinose transferase-like glycosyltransferase
VHLYPIPVALVVLGVKGLQRTAGKGILRNLFRAGTFLIVATLFLIAANLVWLSIDTRPPFWDMAYHQNAALRILDDFSVNGIKAVASVPGESGNYPPLYYCITALFYALFGRTDHAARWANLPAIILLALVTYSIAKRYLDPPAAAIAAVLANFFPFMLWISRESLIEYWLIVLVATSILALLRTNEFADRRFSLIFGATCGLGMLTKWTFAVYVWLPALWYARKNPKNAFLAAGVTCLISAYWYVPRFGVLKEAWELASAGGRNEGDPAVFSWQSVVFYIRLLEGYQLFLPIFVLFIVGIFWILFRSHEGNSWVPVALWLLGGWLGLTLIGNKDPRYSAPLLPAVAIICAAPLQERRAAAVGLFGFLLFQHYLVSFGIPKLPEKIVLARGIQGPLSWDWNLYIQTYLGVWGKPLRQDWQIERVLKEVTSAHGGTVKLGIIPDIPRFDSHAFELCINLRHYPVVINKLWTFDESAFYQNDYVIFSEREQGYPGLTPPDGIRISSYVVDHPQQFHVLDRFELPGRQFIRLYKVDTGL